MLAHADPLRRPIQKRRCVFLWANDYFAWDAFVDPALGFDLLTVEVEAPNQPVALPPFFDIEREVTHERQFTNAALSLR